MSTPQQPASPQPSVGRSGRTENVFNWTDNLPLPVAITMAIGRVNDAVTKFRPVWVSSGLSGGHDSVTAAYIASQAQRFDSAFHINTGVGLEATEKYIEEICRKQGWPLEVFKAMENHRANGKADPQDYFAMIEERGFPGPAMHWKMYQRLKQRQIERFCRANKKWHSREVVMIVSGRRKQESVRRGQKVVGPWEREGRVIWANPLWDFSKLDCSRIMRFVGLPRSPVVDLIHKSGECLCGAFGSQSELKETAMWFRDDPTIRRILGCQERIRAKFGHGWGQEPPCKNSREQRKIGPMCSNCELKTQ